MVRTVSLLLATTLVLGAGSAAAEVFFDVDFENGDTTASVGTARLELTDASIEAVANPAPDAVNGSALVGRFRVESSAEKVRAEISSQRMVTDGQTYRYRWSYYIPRESFTDVSLDWFSVSQWKTWPCEVCNETYDPAICDGCGGIFDDASIVDEQWQFRWRAEPDCHEYHAPVPFDRWVHFEMLVYWTMDSDGYVRLWEDGELVQSMDGIRTLFTSFESGTCDMYWALGLYSRWSGSKDYLELFIDDIQISDETDPPEVSGTGGASGSGGDTGGGDASGGEEGKTDPSGSENGDGCSCRTGGSGGSSSTGNWTWVGLLFLAAGALRRRAC